MAEGKDVANFAAAASAAADRRDTISRWLLSTPALVILLFAAIGPLVIVVIYSFLKKGGYGGVEWESVTTGNFAGAELMLMGSTSGSMEIVTPHVKTTVAVADIGFEDTSFDAGGLERGLRLFRLPDRNGARSFEFEREVEIGANGDSPIYVRVTLENGHQGWSSPIYLFHEAS